MVSFVQLLLLCSSSDDSSKFDDQPLGSDAESEIVPLNLPMDVASTLTLLESPARVEICEGQALMAKSDWLLEKPSYG
jgi:hypothetical protein